MSKQFEQVRELIPASLKAEPQKAGILAILLLGLGVLGVRQLAGPGVAPAAVASPEQPPESSNRNVSASRVAAGQAKADRVRRWIATPVAPVTRNLFVMQAEFFPTLPDAVSSSAAQTLQESFWDRLAKSESARADLYRQRQIRQENLLQAAGSLKLQSTVMGSFPRALIDGRLLKAGQTVSVVANGQSIVFVIDRIEPMRVVLKRDEIMVELPIAGGRMRVVTDNPR